MSASQDHSPKASFYTKDAVIPFLVNESNVRGRVARLEKAVDGILRRHDYPEPVSKALGELLVIASMLASNLKRDGIFTVQIKGNGPVPMFVVDAVYGGALRGFADVKGELGEVSQVTDMTGEGYIAITLDQDGERYQGIVELKGEFFAELIQQYFVQSQQIDTFIHARIAESLNTETKQKCWVAGGIMIERLPEEEAGAELSDAESKQRFEHAYALARTVSDGELLGTELGLSDLLYRLYHEDGVWVYDAQLIEDKCRCSREKVEQALVTMPKADVKEMMEEGEVAVHCHFCNTHHRFNDADIDALFA